MKKIILDVSAGCRMTWYKKNNPHVVFLDKRKKVRGFMSTRPNAEILPDIVADWKQIPFKNKSFKLVLWDPPHTIRKNEEGGIIAERYGRLTHQNWQTELKKGFKECWRVLEPEGVLIFKWAECDKKLKEVLPLFFKEPLFGSRSGNRGQTVWLCFMKI
jgi:SAM-dependent methyltransferase